MLTPVAQTLQLNNSSERAKNSCLGCILCTGLEKEPGGVGNPLYRSIVVGSNRDRESLDGSSRGSESRVINDNNQLPIAGISSWDY